MRNQTINDDWDFLILKRKIFADTSLDLNQYKTNYLKRRIDVRIRARNIKTYKEYYRILKSEPSEYDDLLKDLTINVTHFFRDLEVFSEIENEILPLLIYENVKKQHRTIRLLSVGCASGEEAYSLAILLHYLLGEEFDNFNVSIYGFDIDKESLEKARSGKYHPQQLENVRPEFLEQYFEFDGELYQISSEIRGMVRFKNQDIFSGKLGNHYNLIVCRNVMIYFTKEMQSDLFIQIYNSLKNGGYLIIGKTETIVGEAKEKFKIVNSKERIYKKEN